MSKFKSKTKLAAEEMRSLFPPTPLQKNEYLSALFGAEIFLKREDLSPVRSYKIRGAFNAMRKVLNEKKNIVADQVFVCASAGNHAQGVAFACSHFGVRGKIFMPVTTPSQKISKTAAFGHGAVSIELTGDYFDETLASAQEFANENNGIFLPPFDHPDIIEGQATIALEIESQLPTPPDLIFCPVGGGGLSSGLVSYFGHNGPKFHFVEPQGARSLHTALVKGEQTTLDRIDSFVDGASVARIGDHNFEVLRSIKPANVLAVPENRLCATILDLLNVEGIVLEPAGALTVDALKDLRAEISGKRVVCITSGGNFDFERLPDVKERALKYQGFKKYFILRMPQRPGALKDFLNLLGPEDDIARFEYLKKSARNFGSVLIGIETKNKDGFSALFERMIEEGFSYQDITDDEILSEFLI